MEREVASQYPLCIPAGESRNHVETPAGSAPGKQEWKLGEMNFKERHVLGATVVEVREGGCYQMHI